MSTSALHGKQVSVLGTELSADDRRDIFRQKIARITLDSMVQFVGLLDAKGTVLEINKVALDAVGIKLTEVEGKPFWTTFWWQVSTAINTELKEMIARAAAGEFVRWDTEIFGRAGGKETIIIDASLMPVKDENGKVVFIAAEGRDITEKKAYEREIARQREELAKLDVLKTQFFANISHEFRTPLTLMLGPLEDIRQEVANAAVPLPYGGQVDLVYRNGLRLLKLVNTLLDFSRIEAGRVQAVYEEIDLAELTAHLASEFRSAIEKAGLALVIDCPRGALACVDREMWEKIVLNLLSNAFKFTFEGTIQVSLKERNGTFQLIVADTGTGIPAEELPRLFERFHRVEGAKGRTYEGSGIGLALVQDLARLHGGSVSVESKYGKGSTFRVSVPSGTAHLPQQQIGAPRTQASTGLGAHPFVEEALRWLPDETPVPDEIIETAPPAVPGAALQAQDALILLADDNADMRDYLTHLLSAQYRVEAVGDGESALKAIERRLPSLVLSDVMMPRMDGMELLSRLRADVRTAAVPVILLSARAGEEAKVEALDAGADDYLVKPFGARELLARVDAHLKIAAVRGEVMNSLRESEERYRAFVTATSDVVYRMSADWSEMRHLQGRDFIADTDNPTRTWLETYIRPEDRPQVLAAVDEAIRTKTSFEYEHPIIRRDGTVGWVYSRAVPVCGENGEILEWFGAARDISERKQHAEMQQLLLDELNHRVKNMLAVIQAIAQQTLRQARDPAEFATSFGGRIQSLSRMHSLLSQSGWQAAGLEEIVRDQLAAHEALRVAVAGPPVELEPQLALHMALILHELGTNSTKYGALSRPEGVVSITWTVNDNLLRLAWGERGGPPAKAPFRRGFGTILIEQTVKGESGKSQMTVEAEGLRWEITLPLNTPRADASTKRINRAPQVPVDMRKILAATTPEPLRGKRFLVIEDEPLIALEMLAGLEAAGIDVQGPVGSVEEALRAIKDGTFDAALLDANLRGTSAGDIAAALTRRQIPFAFVTGYGREALPESFSQAIVLTKPFTQRDLLKTADRLIGQTPVRMRLARERAPGV